MAPPLWSEPGVGRLSLDVALESCKALRGFDWFEATALLPERFDRHSILSDFTDLAPWGAKHRGGCEASQGA